MATFRYNLVPGEKIMFKGEQITFEGYHNIDSMFVAAVVAAESLKEKRSKPTKITINLSKAEYAGIKKYLADEDGKITEAEITLYVQGIVSGTINSPAEAVSEYISRESKN